MDALIRNALAGALLVLASFAAFTEDNPTAAISAAERVRNDQPGRPRASSVVIRLRLRR